MQPRAPKSPNLRYTGGIISEMEAMVPPIMTSPRARLHPLGSWIVTALALLAGDRVLDGVFVEGLFPALVAAAALGLINVFIRPVLFVLTLPITFLTLGLFTFVINGAMLWLASTLSPGFHLQAAHSAVALAVIVAIAHAVATALFVEQASDNRP
jgi:putative membrane protein